MMNWFWRWLALGVLPSMGSGSTIAVLVCGLDKATPVKASED
jgi:hypothetical protein